MPRVPLNIPLPGRDPCPYCTFEVRLHKSSEELYNGKDYGPVWICSYCCAYVGCHPGTNRALGRVANKDLRVMKMRAHAAFDPLWQWKKKFKRDRGARGRGYAWLSEQLGIKQEECHIGYFTIDQCQKVIEICSPYKRKLKW